MLRTVKIQDKNLEIKADRKLKADKTNPQHLGSSIPGTVGKVLVKEGDAVTDKIYVQQGDTVSQDDLLISFHIAK